MNDYIHYQRSLSRSVALASISLYHLRADIEEQDDGNRADRQFLKRVTKSKASAGKHWLNYRRSSGAEGEGKAQ